MNSLTRSAVAGLRRTLSLARGPLPAPGAVAGVLLVVTLATTFGPQARAQYCSAGSLHCTRAVGDERITRVVLNTLDSSSDPSIVPPDCYTDNTSLSTALVRGASYPITIEYVNSFSGDKGSAWIDWNQDLDFDDAGEAFVLTRTPGLMSGTIVPPAGAALGNTRLRVRVTYNGTSPPCGQPSQNYGEVQDFTVNVLPATTGACCMPGSGECTITSPGGCPGGTYQGNGSSCSPSNPCGGACCFGGSCAVTLASACPAGSVFINNRVCTPEACVYCPADVTQCFTASNERISRVVFANLDNTSATDVGLPCYTDFSSVSTEVSRGATYAFQLEFTNRAGGERAAVWFDWNRDFVYGNSTGEEVVLTADPALGLFTGTVSVPAGATLGTTAMRVRLTWSSPPVPCGNLSYGDIEDYAVTVAVATTGACCTPGSGVCSIATPAACPGGYQGDATTCTPSNPCGGACCDAAGGCTVTTAAGCASGSVFVNARVCTPTACSYCAPAVSLCGSPGNELITRVVFANLDQSSTPDPTAGCSVDYTGVSTQVTRGATYAVRLEYENVSSTDLATVWFDWNRDFAFGDAASGEEVVLTQPAGVPRTFTGTVTVPAGASLGTARMRARVGYGTIPLTACGNSSYGEVEDYTVTISTVTSGACCVPGSGACSITTAGACSGLYQGDAATCTPTNPCGGICCSGGACSVTTAAACPAGSLFRAGGVCSPGACEYCTPGAYYCNSSSNLLITRVAFVGIDNASAPDQFAPCVTDFTGISTQVSRGATYTFLFEYDNESSPDVAGVWFDWNQDLIFGDAASGEQVALSHPDGNGAAFSGTVTVPAGAPLGNTRMRVRVQYAGTPSPCGLFGYGETEDYTVTVVVAVTGACCTPGSGACSITSPGGCAGAYQGNATTCSPVNPCGGSCCTGGNCAVTTPAACTGSSVFIAGAPCGPTSCNYCVAGVTNCNSAENELITRVLFAGIDNASAPDDAAPCYNDYTSISGQAARGSTQTFLFEYAYPTSLDHAALWIDWNRDFRLGDAASGEQIALEHPVDNPSAYTAQVTVPAGASLGATRMRVRVMWAGTPVACGNNSYGEVEDYTLIITNPTCPADFNGQNGVDLLDIFAFLNAWFTGCTGPGAPSPSCTKSADFNGQNGVDLLDIFAFLTAWFAGPC